MELSTASKVAIALAIINFLLMSTAMFVTSGIVFGIFGAAVPLAFCAIGVWGVIKNNANFVLAAIIIDIIAAVVSAIWAVVLFIVAAGLDVAKKALKEGHPEITDLDKYDSAYLWVAGVFRLLNAVLLVANAYFYFKARKEINAEFAHPYPPSGPSPFDQENAGQPSPSVVEGQSPPGDSVKTEETQ